MIMDNSPPDLAEIQAIEAESRHWHKRRFYRLTRHMTSQDWTAHWDEQNRRSIARGDGPLPF